MSPSSTHTHARTPFPPPSISFALIFGIALTGIQQTLISGNVVTDNQKVGGAMVVVAMYLHASYGEKVRNERHKDLSLKGKSRP